MELGVNLPHFGREASPSLVRDVAQAADELGYGSVWTVDHLALMPQTKSFYTLKKSPTGIGDDALKSSLSPLYECVSTMAFVAAVTKRVKIVSGVMVLPLRNPLYNARQLATIDAYSDGRLVLGVGAGWLEEEATALGMPWDKRGARMEDHIALMRTLWTSDAPYTPYDGPFYRFEAIDPAPFPAQRPIPILIGGHSEVALKRAGRIGDGWLSSDLPVEAQAKGMEAVRAAAVAAGRDASTLQWQGSVTVKGRDPASVEQLVKRLKGYQELGVHGVALIVNHIEAERRGIARAPQTETMAWIAREIFPQFSS